ncbi:endolytic transglycosylase MltG [Marinicrinis sediminis]|uniref:Endolytic murein transglycosylase n=1 Tax=Marinicrinis sediminis TaxID=1652465 RepID=A0ABW5R8F0_9BACL
MYGKSDEEQDYEQRNISGEIVERAPKRKRWKRVMLVILIPLLFISGIVAGGAAYVIQALQPVEAEGGSEAEAIEFVIERGMSSREIANQLEQEGLIRDGLIFQFYLRYRNEGSRFQAGTYALEPGMDKDAIIAKLNSGDVVQAEMKTLTIPEGFTVKQIAPIMAALSPADEASFLDAMKNPDEEWIANLTFPEATAKPDRDEQIRSYLQAIPESDQYMYKLEGYLFPESYDFVKDAEAEMMVARTFQELGRKLELLFQAKGEEPWQEQLDQRLAQLGFSFHDLMTIASLIEREVVVDEERPIVASVIYNRLNDQMPLQIDATVQYLLDKQKERLLYADLEVDSPYNTYQNAGLPPGPIAAPGIASIEAALFPDETPYYYYVTKKDGTFGHLFAETYDQHLENKRKSEQNG